MLFILVGLTAVGSIACFGVSQEAVQLALDEQDAAAQRQADTAAQHHAQALADKDSAANAMIAELQDQLDVANKENSSAATQLNAEVADLKSQIGTAREQTNAERAKTAEARGETRWSWVSPADADSSPRVYGIAATPADVVGLIAHCQPVRNVLFLWEDSPYETDDYTVDTGFDEERLGPEWTYGLDSFPLLMFTHVDASELWRSKTVSVGNSYGTTTWDTAQLRRMFPTEKAFCDGERPKSN